MTPEINLGVTLTLHRVIPDGTTIPLAVSVYSRDWIRAIRAAWTRGGYVYAWHMDMLRELTDDILTVPGDMWVSGFCELRRALARLEELEGKAEALATPAQAERMAEDPEAREIELLTIVRSQLFKPFGEFRKRVRMRSRAVSHKDDCTDPVIAWSTIPCGSVRSVFHEFTLDQVLLEHELVEYDPRHRVPHLVERNAYNGTLSISGLATLTRVQDAAAGAALHPWLADRDPDRRSCKLRLQARRHLGVCQGCGAQSSEHAVLVTIPWAGREISREYVL